MKTFRLKQTGGQNQGRFAIIVGLMTINVFGALVDIVWRKYPWGLAAVLFLIPCLLRELDLRSGKRMRRMGSFEWSCVAAGLLFLLVMPLLIRSPK